MLMVAIPTAFQGLGFCHGILHDQKQVFVYKSSELIRDRDRGLCMMAYTEQVVRVCVNFLMVILHEYHSWYIPPDIISFAMESGRTL